MRSRVVRTSLGFPVPRGPTSFLENRSRFLRGYSSPAVPASERILENTVEEDETLATEIISINEEISRCVKEISKNQLKLKNVESELLVLFSAGIVDPGAEKKRDLFDDAIRYKRRSVTQLMAFQLSLRDKVAKKEAELVDRKNKSDESLKAEQNRLKWARPKIAPSSITVNHLFFVNREEAVRKLLGIHRNHFTLRHYMKGGATPQVAIMDDAYGMGKTMFAGMYIEMCHKATLPDFGHPDFKQSILDTRTITVRLPGSCLLQPARESPEAANRALSDLIYLEMSNLKLMGDLSGDLSRLSEIQNSAELLKSFIEITQTPLFLVLDEIGGAFSGSSPVTGRRSVFMDFCSNVLSRWITISHLFFILVGRGDIFNFVGTRITPEKLSGSPFDFQRISLKLIGVENIERILSQTTKMKDGKETTLADYFGIAQEEIPLYAKEIQDVTNGHPRSMLDLLKHSESKPDLMRFDGKGQTVDVANWTKSLIPHTAVIRKLLKAINGNAKIDLTQPAFPVKRSRSLEELLPTFLIRYEGEITSATLFASSFALKHLSGMFSPFREFISLYTRITDLKFDHAANFETCCLKRFQEIFGSSISSPASELLPNVFKTTTLGMLEGFSATSEVVSIPQVKEDGKPFTSMDQETVKLTDWPQLLAEMVKLAPCCFTPLAKSASSDVIIMSEGILHGTPCFVTIGLAAKCYSSATELSNAEIQNELALFNRMFSNTLSPNASDFRKQINLLFVCCTGPLNNKRKKKAGSHEYWRIDKTGFEHITEAIYLDLSTPDSRSRFFGLTGEDDMHLRENLEMMINKGSKLDMSQMHALNKHAD